MKYTVKKSKITGFGIIGLIFSLIGICFGMIGIGIAVFVRGEVAVILGMVYIPIGVVFFLLGLLFLLLQRRKEKILRQVRNAGHFVVAEVDRVVCNVNIQYHNMHPYMVYCSYADERGGIHHFKSRNLMFNPQGMLLDNQVRVYVNPDNMKQYDVDIDAILPNIINHTESGYQGKNKGVFICGVIFTIIGALFNGIGLLITFLAARYAERWMFLIIFGGIGGIFLIMGIIFLLMEARKKSMVKRLKGNGRYVNAVIKSAAVDTSVEYGGMAGTAAAFKNMSATGTYQKVFTTNPLFLQCSYVASDETEHIFRSESKVGIDLAYYMGKNVKVYYIDADFRKYYVDLESVM